MVECIYCPHHCVRRVPNDLVPFQFLGSEVCRLRAGILVILSSEVRLITEFPVLKMARQGTK